MKFSPGRLMIALFVSITISGLAGLDLSSSLILAGVFYLVFTKLFATPNNVGKVRFNTQRGNSVSVDGRGMMLLACAYKAIEYYFILTVW